MGNKDSISLKLEEVEIVDRSNGFILNFVSLKGNIDNKVVGIQHILMLEGKSNMGNGFRLTYLRRVVGVIERKRNQCVGSQSANGIRSISGWCETGQYLRMVKCGSLYEIEAIVDLMVQLKERL